MTTAGVLQIADGCQEFVLVVHNVQQPVLGCGDGLRMKHMVHCRYASFKGATPARHCYGLVDALQTFSKELSSNG